MEISERYVYVTGISDSPIVLLINFTRPVFQFVILGCVVSCCAALCPHAWSPMPSSWQVTVEKYPGMTASSRSSGEIVLFGNETQTLKMHLPRHLLGCFVIFCLIPRYLFGIDGHAPFRLSRDALFIFSVWG